MLTPNRICNPLRNHSATWPLGNGYLRQGNDLGKGNVRTRPARSEESPQNSHPRSEIAPGFVRLLPAAARFAHPLRMLKLLILLLLATDFPLCGSGKRVTCVVDGDTFWLRGEKIRPEGFDAPEMGAPKCRRKAPLADAAAAELARVLSSGKVAIEGNGRSYDRRLARVTVDGVDIAGPMIASGLARPYRRGAAAWCGP